MKKFFNTLAKGEDIFHSSKPAAISAFLLVAIIITSLLSVRYYLLKDIIKNGVATKTIQAKNTFQVIDKQRTEIARRAAERSIQPIIIPAEIEDIKNDLDRVTTKIKEIRTSKASLEVKKEELFNLLEISDVNRKEQAISYILSATDVNLNSTFTDTKQFITQVFTNGTYSTDIDNFASDKDIEENLGAHVKKNQYPVIAGITCSVIPAITGYCRYNRTRYYS